VHQTALTPNIHAAGRIYAPVECPAQRPRPGCDALYFAVAQFGPLATLTSSGTDRLATPDMASLAIAESRSISSAGDSKDELVVDLEHHARAEGPRREDARSTSIMASFMMSAAVPCMGWSSPCARPKDRRLKFEEASSGMRRLRPKSVTAKPSRCAVATVSSRVPTDSGVGGVVAGQSFPAPRRDLSSANRRDHARTARRPIPKLNRLGPSSHTRLAGLRLDAEHARGGGHVEVHPAR